MRLALTILLCKALRFILKSFGRGSSMPGKIALKLYPSVLSKVELPEYVIAVTGSNGKTSTVEMIHQVLEKAGLSVAYNYEGSNQIDGVATLILTNCSTEGVFKKDILLIETDERYAQYTFKHVKPTHYVITNLYRDQMTRNGNPEFVLNEIRKSINKKSTLVLNSDDPLISSLDSNDIISYYFGINDNQYTKEVSDFIYDDGSYCPRCKSKLIYDYRQFGHIGKYHCTKCKFKRKNPDFYISDIDLDNGELIINNKYEIKLAFNSIYNAYNILAAYAVTNLIGVKPKVIVEALNNYLVKNGRVKHFKLGLHRGTLLISKHENSVSYNKNIDYVVSQKENVTVFLMVDAISRKYFTSETSWLWDINFERLSKNNVVNIVVTGLYASDVLTRLQYANIDMSKVYANKNIHEAIEYTKENAEGYIYVLTCFSDENKFINEVNATW